MAELLFMYIDEQRVYSIVYIPVYLLLGLCLLTVIVFPNSCD